MYEYSDLCDAVFIARRAGVTRRMVDQWVATKERFPKPVRWNGGVRIFYWPDVERWLQDTGRIEPAYQQLLLIG